MSRLIDADKLKVIMRDSAIAVIVTDYTGEKTICFGLTEKEILQIIDNAKTVDINTELSVAYLKGRRQGQSEERPTGEWKLVSNICNEINVVCPFCDNTRIFAYAHGYSIDEVKSQLREVNDLPNYCENCGAKMKKGEEE